MFALLCMSANEIFIVNAIAISIAIKEAVCPLLLNDRNSVEAIKNKKQSWKQVE